MHIPVKYSLPRSKAEAKSRGAMYYTEIGKPCRNGHYSKRYTTSGKCVACVRENKEKHANKSDVSSVKDTRKRIEKLKETSDFEESW